MSTLAVSTEAAGTACLLTVEGVLDTTTYLKLRDNIIKAALDEPRAVLVDVNDLGVTVSSAWSVFTSARCMSAPGPTSRSFWYVDTSAAAALSQAPV
jgi:anti-anti-sigma regulatory factor